MGHKYIKRDGTWIMSFKYASDNVVDESTVIRVCPVCKFIQPLDANMLHIIDFSQCPQCHAKLDIPKKMKG